ncbi:MAG: inositol monophosphatase family protein [Actinomycetota bacterium]
MNDDPGVEALALEVAARVREAVAPALGRADARTGVGVAPGGDVTMAIDEIAEAAVDAVCTAAGDIAYYSEDRGWVAYGTPRAVLVVDPIDGTRPAAAGLESCCVSVAVAPPSEDARLGEISFGVVHEIKSGQVFAARRGGGVRADVPIRRSANTDLRALFWTAGLRGRPALPLTVALERLIDGSSMHGGFFDLGSATFNMTRLVTGQLDAYVDIGMHVVERFPATEARFRAAGDGAICTNFPYDVAAAALIVTEAGGVVTRPDGSSIADHPAVGSGDGFGIAVLAAASPELHGALLDAVATGMGRLRAWLSVD